MIHGSYQVITDTVKSKSNKSRFINGFCKYLGLAKIGETEWYFYVPRDRNGNRPSRMTERGFWKATGSDRPVRSAANPRRLIGLKKTLVYYEGRAPRGAKTEWVMKEYRLPEYVASATKVRRVEVKSERNHSRITSTTIELNR